MSVFMASVGISSMVSKVSFESLKSSYFGTVSPFLSNTITTPTAFTFETPLKIESAHKKGSGSTKNGRDSNAQRLGVKVYGDQPAKAGSIIVRQRGTRWHPGNNVGLGKDYTIYAKIDGLVKFEKKGLNRALISVYPNENVRVENPNCRRVRRREAFRVQREKKRELRDEGYYGEPLISIAEVPEGEDEETAVC